MSLFLQVQIYIIYVAYNISVYHALHYSKSSIILSSEQDFTVTTAMKLPN